MAVPGIHGTLNGSVVEEEPMERYRLAVVIEKDDDGYFAYCPQLQGCYTQGDTYEETLANIKEAVSLVIEDMIACGEEVSRYI